MDLHVSGGTEHRQNTKEHLQVFWPCCGICRDFESQNTQNSNYLYLSLSLS